MMIKRIVFAVLFIAAGHNTQLFAIDPEIEQLRKIISIQEAKIAALQQKACVLTTVPEGNCTKVSCGSQVTTICNGLNGVNGGKGDKGDPGVNATNNLIGRIECTSTGNYDMLQCCKKGSRPNSIFGIWDGEQKLESDGKVRFGVWCFAQ